MQKNWIKIYSANNQIELEIIKQMLEEHKIQSIIMNTQDSAHNMPFGGTIDLYVIKEQMQEAIKYLEKNSDERNT